jgi:predicted transglutaminase-like cysteine proteinase
MIPPTPFAIAEMSCRAPLLRLALLIVLAISVLPAVGGLVDFSAGLLAWVERSWGPEAPPRLFTWQRLLRDTQGTVTDSKNEGLALRRVNTFFNQVPFISDLQHWGVEDYWATPVEFLGSFGGDCEDYSIAKFLSLKELAIPVGNLRITYVRAKNLGESHMVLAYYATPEAEPLILDSLIGDIRPASQRPDLEPVYSFNDEDLWLPDGTNRKGGSTQVRLWRELLERLAREQRM